MQFELLPLRFNFVALEPVRFPAGKSANSLRGAFGVMLRQVCCSPDCPGARECPVRANCSYARLFEPSAQAGGPSGLTDWPRPFVFRATHLDGKTIAPGAAFSFDIHLFDTNNAAIDALQAAFRQLATEGLGPSRGRAELISVLQLDEDGRTWPFSRPPTPLTIDLNQTAAPITQVRVRFVTPTELKDRQAIAPEPDFSVLASRIRDRVSTLRELYGSGQLAIDFRGFRERAERIKMTRCEVTHLDVARRSSRTGQVHSIGGFIGEADYEGDLGEFIPYLRAAKWTGVGRQTVWGKGEIEYCALTSARHPADK